MTRETLNLGQRLGGKRSVPDYIQLGICVVALLLFAALWQLHVVSIPTLMFSTLAGTVAVFVGAHYIPALCSTITIYEHGLETTVRGKSAVFGYDKINCMTAELTHRLINGEYARTMAKLEFFVDGRLSPYKYECDFRRGEHGEALFALVLENCSQAIQRRLLAELERQGAVRWRDNISLTPDGILLADATNASRLIPYRELAEWKLHCNDLKIWKVGDALPCLVIGNETPNFGPLFRLFESLCKATRKTDPTCKVEPPLAAYA